MKTKLFSFVVLLIVLTGCIPTQTGSSEYLPLDISSSRSFDTQPGTTKFVSVEYSPEYWDTSDTSLRVVLPPLRGGLRAGDVDTTPVGWMSFTDVRVPNGWKAWLARANAKRKITKLAGDYIYYSISIELIIGVEVPSSETKPGVVNADVRYNANGKVNTIRLGVNVPQK